MRNQLIGIFQRVQGRFAVRIHHLIFVDRPDLTPLPANVARRAIVMWMDRVWWPVS